MFKTILKTVKQEKTKSQISEPPKLDEDLVQQQPQQLNVQFPPKKNINLQNYQIKGIKDVYYIKEFINQEQADYLFNCIYSHNQWNVLKHAKRRVQKLGGEVTNDGLKDIQDLPFFINDLCISLDGIVQKPINHVLINEYERGIGIMPHTDGPLYHNFVTIISLGSPVIFKFTRNNQTIQLLVEPQSLLVFTSEAYIEWLHGIEYYDEDSIFFNYENGSITNSNIVNFKESNLASLITVSDEKETQINQNLIMIRLEKQEYQYVLLMKRNLRVSLTLRHVNKE